VNFPATPNMCNATTTIGIHPIILLLLATIYSTTYKTGAKVRNEHKSTVKIGTHSTDEEVLSKPSNSHSVSRKKISCTYKHR